MQIEKVAYHGWQDCVRLTNGNMELIVTTEVGPRIIYCGFCGGKNLFANMSDELGGKGESEFQLRGGHRFWIAPETAEITYEPDNVPVHVALLPDGVHLRQEVGTLSGCQKEITIRMHADANRVDLLHRITNCGQKTLRMAPWALSVMAPGGVAVIPLPPKVPHTESWLHNQLWTIWPYTNLADGRWTLGERFILFRQDANKGPGKIGLLQAEGWAAYQLDTDLFVKRFECDQGATYPDGGVNFETFSNEDFLELESLGGLIDLAPGQSVDHTECWELYTATEPVVDEQSAARLPPASGIR